MNTKKCFTCYTCVPPCYCEFIGDVDFHEIPCRCLFYTAQDGECNWQDSVITIAGETE